MNIKLSSELRNKLKKMLVSGNLSSNPIMHHTMVFKGGGNIELTAEVFFTYEEQDLVKEIIEWGKHICKYFKTSYETYKVNIGRLEGVFPIGVESTCEGTQVEFSIDNIKPESWKDWFIQEGV